MRQFQRHLMFFFSREQRVLADLPQVDSESGTVGRRAPIRGERQQIATVRPSSGVLPNGLIFGSAVMTFYVEFATCFAGRVRRNRFDGRAQSWRDRNHAGRSRAFDSGAPLIRSPASDHWTPHLGSAHRGMTNVIILHDVLRCKGRLSFAGNIPQHKGRRPPPSAVVVTKIRRRLSLWLRASNKRLLQESAGAGIGTQAPQF